jgi:hypothetical protein
MCESVFVLVCVGVCAFHLHGDLQGVLKNSKKGRCDHQGKVKGMQIRKSLNTEIWCEKCVRQRGTSGVGKDRAYG